MTKNPSKPMTHMVSVMGFEGLVRVWLSRPMGYPCYTLWRGDSDYHCFSPGSRVTVGLQLGIDLAKGGVLTSVMTTLIALRAMAHK